RGNWLAQSLGHFTAVLLEPGGVAAESADAVEFTHLADRGELRTGLRAGADDSEDARLRTRHIFRRDRAGSSCAHLPEIIGFDQGRQFAAIGAIEQHHKASDAMRDG